MEYILITGGAGFIGLNLATQLANKRKHIIIVDDLKNAYVQNIKRFIKHNPTTLFFRHDVTDAKFMKTIFQKYTIESIVHLAAKKYVDESFIKEKEYYKNNIDSLKVMLNMCEKYEIAQFVFSSTITVYGNPLTCPVDENAPKNPLSPYAKTKLMGEEIIQDWQKKNKTKCIIFRFSNPVGANLNFYFGDQSKKKKLALIPYAIKTAKNNEQLKLNGNTFPTIDGTPVRDYIHIVDLTSIVACTILNKNNHKLEIYNVGCGKEGYSVLQVVKQIENELHKPINYIFGECRKGDCPKFVCDITKLKQEQFVSPSKDLQEMVQSQIVFMEHINASKK